MKIGKYILCLMALAMLTGVLADGIKVTDSVNAGRSLPPLPQGTGEFEIDAPRSHGGVVGKRTYCVIDLSEGPRAKRYPVSYQDEIPAGGWSDDYRLNKLVLRRIDTERPYYLGVFELTQRQYELIMGRNPSALKGEMRPVDCVTWETVRGKVAQYPWPDTDDVDADRLIGRLRARTGLKFDLPTEAQWEFACRAGSRTAYGKPLDGTPGLNRMGRHLGNRTDGKGGFAEHTKVGSYAPNDWGLYDMHGNVWEWCLDGHRNGAKDLFRIMRGGCWASDAETCAAHFRNAYLSFDWCYDVYIGIRLAVTEDQAKTESSKSDAACLVCPNPIVAEGKFLSDPAGRVGPDGVLRVFCSRDESVKYYCSTQNDVLSTSDMAHWTQSEGVFKGEDIGGKATTGVRLYAPDGIFLNNKWWLFYCTPNKRYSEGLAQCDSAIGRYVQVRNFTECLQFDPSVFQDDDGSVYLYWGQFTVKAAKLKKDLSGFEPNSLRESIIDCHHHYFHEGVQAFKRNGIYYLSYTDVSRNGCSCIGYATAPTPFGPFVYRGVIVDNRGSDPCSNNNHGSVVEFNGKWYVFYHRQSNGVASLRKACVEPIEFDDDGLIKEVEMTCNGAGAPLDLLQLTEARLACLMSGHVRVTTLANGQERLTGIRNGDTATWRYFQCAKIPTELELEVLPLAGGRVEAVDGSGRILGSGAIPAGDGSALRKVMLRLQNCAAGKHISLTLRFHGAQGKDLCELESFIAR